MGSTVNLVEIGASPLSAGAEKIESFCSLIKFNWFVRKAINIWTPTKIPGLPKPCVNIENVERGSWRLRSKMGSGF